MTLTPNQSANVYINFIPTAAGTASGTVSIASNAVNSMVQVTITGVGITSQGTTHSVELSWTPSSSTVVGYFIYRSNVTGGPYTKLNATADPNSNYTDTGLPSGTYFYVVTAVDSNNVESGYSNEVQVIIP
jgi:fibronectin type 3 domain-containing protein